MNKIRKGIPRGIQLGNPEPQFPAVIRPRGIAHGSWIHERLVDKVVAGEGHLGFHHFPSFVLSCPEMGVVLGTRTVHWVMGI